MLAFDFYDLSKQILKSKQIFLLVVPKYDVLGISASSL